MMRRVCVGLGVALAIPAAAMGQADRGTAAKPVTSPGEWFPQTDMPAESIVRAQTGAVIIRLDVDAGGTVSGCSVIQSSGISLLDAAACGSAKRNGRFRPRLDVNGKPVPTTFTLPRIRYILDSGGRSAVSINGGKRVITNRITLVTVAASGIIEACRSLNADTSDAKACGSIVGKAFPGYPSDEKRRTLTISETIVADELPSQ